MPDASTPKEPLPLTPTLDTSRVTSLDTPAPPQPSKPLAPWMRDLLLVFTTPTEDGRLLTVWETCRRQGTSMASIRKWTAINPAFQAAWDEALLMRDTLSFACARDSLNAARNPVAERLIDDALHAPHARDRIRGADILLHGTGVLQRDAQVVVVSPAQSLVAELRAWNAERRAAAESQPALDEARACVESTEGGGDAPTE